MLSRSAITTARARVAAVSTVGLASLGCVLMLSAPAEAGGFSCSGSGPVYAVEAGDGWYSIAARVGVTAAALLDANDAVVTDSIFPGDRLCLPRDAETVSGCGSSSRTYTVRAGDSWFGLANGSGVTLSALLAANAATVGRAIHPGDTLCLPAGASPKPAASLHGYTVRSGDSWYGIAERAGVSMRALLGANGADSGTLLLPGATVNLPEGARQPTSAGARSLKSAPVRGACWFSDTWGAPRSGGRRHQGVDIIAAEGTYVRAVVDGRLTRRSWDQPGKRAGNAWTLTGLDGTTYFYGHLLDFAPGLRVGSRVSAGEIIGFIGETGNTDTPHLHFEIHPGGGSAVNPYSAVRAMGECGRAIG